MRIREAHLGTDRDALISILTENLSGHGGEGHFDWLYQSNPEGTARAWLVEEDTGGPPIGVAAAFPRQVWVQGEKTVCWNLGDFAISSEFRSLGPALMLQRACISAVTDGQVPFAYDHPSCNMMPIYERIGFPATGRVTRYVRLLRLDEKVKGFWKEKLIGKGVIALGNLVLSLERGGSLQRGGYQAILLEDRFDSRFTDLDERVAPAMKVVGRRSAEYLNWRYRDNPLASYQAVAVEHDGRLLGYAVWKEKGKEATLMDLFGEQDAAVSEAILAGVIYTLKQRGIHSLSAPLLGTSPLVPILERWGFRGRESVPFVVSTPKQGRWDGIVNDENQWFLTPGDRDV
jgi:hypothetical protein